MYRKPRSSRRSAVREAQLPAARVAIKRSRTRDALSVPSVRQKLNRSAAAASPGLLPDSSTRCPSLSAYSISVCPTRSSVDVPVARKPLPCASRTKSLMSRMTGVTCTLTQYPGDWRLRRMTANDVCVSHDGRRTTASIERPGVVRNSMFAASRASYLHASVMSESLCDQPRPFDGGATSSSGLRGRCV